MSSANNACAAVSQRHAFASIKAQAAASRLLLPLDVRLLARAHHGLDAQGRGQAFQVRAKGFFGWVALGCVRRGEGFDGDGGSGATCAPAAA